MSFPHSKNSSFIKLTFSSLFSLKTILWNNIHILRIVNSKQYRMQNTEFQETWASIATFRNKICFACCCLLHQSVLISTKQGIQFETGYKFRQSHRIFQGFIIIAYHHVKFTLKYNQDINILIDKYKRWSFIMGTSIK